MSQVGGEASKGSTSVVETGVNLMTLGWQSEESGSEYSTGWECLEELLGTETNNEEQCYKVSTKSSRYKDRQEEHKEHKKKKKDKHQNETSEEQVSLSQDSDYQRDHQKLFYPKIEAEVKRQLEELETKEAQLTLEKDLVVVETLRKKELEEVWQKQEVEAKMAITKEKGKVDTLVPKVEAKARSYDIKLDLWNCPVTATLGQLLKDNPQYRKQVKDMVVGKRKRRLPKVGTTADVMTIYEDLGAPKISIQISGCALSYVPVDEGSEVNLMIEAVAFELGFEVFEPTARTLRMADGAKVIPIGILTQVITLIGGKEFHLNYLVMRPSRPSPFPVLLGRPWLYGAQVVGDWGKKEFCFGKPAVVVSWDPNKPHGETTHELEEYDFDIPSALEEDEEAIYLENFLHSLSEEEVFGGAACRQMPSPTIQIKEEILVEEVEIKMPKFMVGIEESPNDEASTHNEGHEETSKEGDYNLVKFSRVKEDMAKIETENFQNKEELDEDSTEDQVNLVMSLWEDVDQDVQVLENQENRQEESEACLHLKEESQKMELTWSVDAKGEDEGKDPISVEGISGVIHGVKDQQEVKEKLLESTPWVLSVEIFRGTCEQHKGPKNPKNLYSI
ncbi:unnamed protein product [Calypogeia fissa]